MMFNKSSSFNLMFGGEQFTQDYSCSKVILETPNIAKFQLFSQSQVFLQSKSPNSNHPALLNSVSVHTNVSKQQRKVHL